LAGESAAIRSGTVDMGLPVGAFDDIQRCRAVCPW
jgi:hypothetical protein